MRKRLACLGALAALLAAPMARGQVLRLGNLPAAPSAASTALIPASQGGATYGLTPSQIVSGGGGALSSTLGPLARQAGASPSAAVIGALGFTPPHLSQPDPAAQHNLSIGWDGTQVLLNVDGSNLSGLALKSDLTNISASSIKTGTLPAGQLPAFTGDVMSAGATGALQLVNSASARSNLGLGSAATQPTSAFDASGAAAAAQTYSTNASNLNQGTVPPSRMPAFTGDVTSQANSSSLALAATGVTAGPCLKPTVDAKGRATGCAALAASDVVAGLSYTPVHPSYTGQSGGNHVIGIGWNGTHANLDVDNGNAVLQLALSNDLAAYLPASGALAMSGPLALNFSAPQGANGSNNYDAGQMLGLLNQALGGSETRTVSLGTSPGGNGYVRSPHAGLDFVTGATLVQTCSGTICQFPGEVFTKNLIWTGNASVATSAGTPRAILTTDGSAENGNNSGSNFEIVGVNDANTALTGAYFNCNRASLVCNFSVTPTVNGTSLGSGSSSCTSNCGTSYTAGSNIAINGGSIAVAASPTFNSVSASGLSVSGATTLSGTTNLANAVTCSAGACNFSSTPTVNGTAIGSGGCTSNCGTAYVAGSNIAISGSTLSVSATPAFTTVTASQGVRTGAGYGDCLNTSSVCEVYVASAVSNLSTCGTAGKIYTYNATGTAIRSLDMCGNETVLGNTYVGAP